MTRAIVFSILCPQLECGKADGSELSRAGNVAGRSTEGAGTTQPTDRVRWIDQPFYARPAGSRRGMFPVGSGADIAFRSEPVEVSRSFALTEHPLSHGSGRSLNTLSAGRQPFSTHCKIRRTSMPHAKLASTVLAVALALGVLPFGAVAQMPPAQQTPQLSKKEVKVLIATARTSADHEKIAAYYRAEGQRLKADQQDHQEMLEAYLKNPSSHPIPKWPTMEQHCRNLIVYYGKAAQQAFALEDLHDQMAKEASSGK